MPHGFAVSAWKMRNAARNSAFSAQKTEKLHGFCDLLRGKCQMPHGFCGFRTEKAKSCAKSKIFRTENEKCCAESRICHTENAKRSAEFGIFRTEKAKSCTEFGIFRAEKAKSCEEFWIFCAERAKFRSGFPILSLAGAKSPSHAFQPAARFPKFEGGTLYVGERKFSVTEIRFPGRHSPREPSRAKPQTEPQAGSNGFAFSKQKMRKAGWPLGSCVQGRMSVAHSGSSSVDGRPPRTAVGRVP